eukprot:CAMPEP_0171140908 /NCGR_PEP_ID=MMETSP0766_2-20121228/139643_1 /TAXON_ID=439317 /ORGANISM="Gambierdiscus australes, Strain CAWD 149" /LENGTH=39 /DNA_ID= /DNA_START= /DNA_END= /DNA_ORIENTATION=
MIYVPGYSDGTQQWLLRMGPAGAGSNRWVWTGASNILFG